MSRNRVVWAGGVILITALATAVSAWQKPGSEPAAGQSAGQSKVRREQPEPPAARAARRAAALPAKPAGFDISPVTNVADPYPTWNGVAVDPENNVVAFSDLNRHGYILYDRMAHSEGDEVTPHLKHIMGNKTGLGFVSGIQLDPVQKLVYIAENDGWGLRTFSYDDDGNVAPRNLVATPHQVWGIGLSRARKEMVVGVEEMHTVLVWKQDATKLDPPLRVIKGPHTGLADPHGIFMDAVNNEIVVINHGNWMQYHPNTDHDKPPVTIPISPGHFDEPSIRFYPVTANGDVAAARVIQGKKAGLDWPMQIDVDNAHNEIAVANFGADSIAIFRRSDQGDVAPIRELHGVHKIGRAHV